MSDIHDRSLLEQSEKTNLAALLVVVKERLKTATESTHAPRGAVNAPSVRLLDSTRDLVVLLERDFQLEHINVMEERIDAWRAAANRDIADVREQPAGKLNAVLDLINHIDLIENIVSSE